MDALLEYAFERYYETSGLFGTPQRCLAMVDKLSEAGVDEIACLIDFGVATDTVLAHLPHLKGLRMPRPPAVRAATRVNVAEEISRNAVTHLQCTPSMAAMLARRRGGRAALSRLKLLMVGGEALPVALARELRSLVPGDRAQHVRSDRDDRSGPRPADLAAPATSVADRAARSPTPSVYVLDAGHAAVPVGVAGELYIGGAGVRAATSTARS